MRMRVLRGKMRLKLRMRLPIFKNEGLIKTKSASFMTLHIKIFIIEASKWSEMLEKLPLKST